MYAATVRVLQGESNIQASLPSDQVADLACLLGSEFPELTAVRDCYTAAYKAYEDGVSAFIKRLERPANRSVLTQADAPDLVVIHNNLIYPASLLLVQAHQNLLAALLSNREGGENSPTRRGFGDYPRFLKTAGFFTSSGGTAHESSTEAATWEVVTPCT